MQLTQNQQAAAEKDSRSMLVIDDVGKIYPNGTVAVQHADLHVGEGECLGFVGHSGCGK
ncbi:ABC transporter ATP-binding protein, partial [Paenibacillus sp. 28ISP30-2]|nr:ABC transporter ATP-binding protein [Paenibacillus sp. 28ISP30-2]